MNVITKTKQAIGKILQPLRADETTTATTEKSGALKGPADDGLTELIVWSVPAVNARLLICHAPGVDGGNPMNLVNVTVKDNARFFKKMALRARQVSERKFNLEGPLPRRRGHW